MSISTPRYLAAFHPKRIPFDRHGVRLSEPCSRRLPENRFRSRIQPMVHRSSEDLMVERVSERTETAGQRQVTGEGS